MLKPGATKGTFVWTNTMLQPESKQETTLGLCMVPTQLYWRGIFDGNFKIQQKLILDPQISHILAFIWPQSYVILLTVM